MTDKVAANQSRTLRGAIKDASPASRSHARTLRRPQTRAEQALWRCLRDRRLEGYKFRRQFPLGNYIADFCCLAARVIVELDGETHLDREGYDAKRTEEFEKKGFRVIRFLNSQVYKDKESVLQVILAECRTRATPAPPSPLPLSPRGEGDCPRSLLPLTGEIPHGVDR